jgi:hypothetical protein
MNETAVMPALGVNALELSELQRNPQFPQPVGGLWNSGAIAAFGALMAAALAAWPTLTPAAYASANWGLLATSTPGSFTPSPGGYFGGANTVGLLGSGAAPTGIYGRGGGLFD